MSGTYCRCYPDGPWGCAIHSQKMAADKIADSNYGLGLDLVRLAGQVETLNARLEKLEKRRWWKFWGKS